MQEMNKLKTHTKLNFSTSSKPQCICNNNSFTVYAILCKPNPSKLAVYHNRGLSQLVTCKALEVATLIVN